MCRRQRRLPLQPLAAPLLGHVGQRQLARQRAEDACFVAAGGLQRLERSSAAEVLRVGGQRRHAGGQRVVGPLQPAIQEMSGGVPQLGRRRADSGARRRPGHTGGGRALGIAEPFAELAEVAPRLRQRRAGGVVERHRLLQRRAADCGLPRLLVRRSPGGAATRPAPARRARRCRRRAPTRLPVAPLPHQLGGERAARRRGHQRLGGRQIGRRRLEIVGGDARLRRGEQQPAALVGVGLGGQCLQRRRRPDGSPRRARTSLPGGARRWSAPPPRAVDEERAGAGRVAVVEIQLRSPHRQLGVARRRRRAREQPVEPQRLLGDVAGNARPPATRPAAAATPSAPVGMSAKARASAACSSSTRPAAPHSRARSSSAAAACWPSSCAAARPHSSAAAAGSSDGLVEARQPHQQLGRRLRRQRAHERARRRPDRPK